MKFKNLFIRDIMMFFKARKIQRWFRYYMYRQ